MVKTIAPCSNEIVSIIIGTQCIQCTVLEETSSNNFNVKCHELFSGQQITLTQLASLEQSIRTFLHSQNIKNAFVALALAQEEEHHVKTVAPHQLLQCQLLAINTPFHCAGITTHALAQEYAVAHGATGESSSSLMSEEDLLCSIGLYLMARKQTQ